MIKLLFTKHKPLPILQLSQCCFHSNPPLMYNMKLMKQSKVLNKLMIASTVKRKRTHLKTGKGDLVVNVKTLNKSTSGSGKGALKRISVLNKLFMRHITDLLTTGEVANKIGGHAIEISKVCVTPDFQKVNIFWLSKDESQEEEKERMLEDIAKMLRHELHRLNVMGMIPQLIFVADTKHASLLALDVQLAKADFGEDFVPTDASFKLKSEFFLNTPLDPEIIDKIQKLEMHTVVKESPLPPMRHDVFGLDQDALMKRIAASIGKSNDAWSKSHLVYHMKKDPNSTGFAIDDGVDISPKEQKLLFTKFLKKRQIMQKKAAKELGADERVLVEDDHPDYNKYLNGVEAFNDEDFENYFNDEQDIKL